MTLSGKKSRRPDFEKVLPDTSVSLVMESLSGPALECSYHYHSEIELTCIVSGTGRVLIGRDSAPFRAGTLAWIGGNVPHLFVSDPNPSGDRNFSKARVLKFGEIFSACPWWELPEFQQARTLFKEGGTGILFEPDNRFAEIFDRLFSLEPAERLGALLPLLVHWSAAPRRVLESGFPALTPDVRTQIPIERALRFLRDHFREDIALDDAAQAAGMEPESFRRLFRRTVRTTFSGYLLELRLNRAARLLGSTDGGILEIALESGFRNVSNFNRLFLKYRGASPGVWRRSLDRKKTDQASFR